MAEEQGEALPEAFEWVLIFRHDVSDEELKTRVLATKSLKAAGLVCVTCKSSDSSEVQVYVRAPLNRLEAEAQALGLQKPLLHGGGLAPFSIEKRHHFDGGVGQAAFFSSAERQRLIWRIMTAGHRESGANLEFEKLEELGHLRALMPLHERAEQSSLVRRWWKRPFWEATRQPLHDIRNYFGEEIAFYFAWVGHMVGFLWPLAVVGVLIEIIKGGIGSGEGEVEMGGEGSGTTREAAKAWLDVTFLALLLLWASVYPFAWVRRQHELATLWGVAGCEEEEHTVSLQDGEIDAEWQQLMQERESSDGARREENWTKVDIIRILSLILQVMVLLLVLTGAVMIGILMRVARDSISGELTTYITVLFAIAEGGRVVGFESLGVQLLDFLARFDSVIRIQSERSNFSSAKKALYDCINCNVVPVYIVLTTTFADPRDLQWPARCYKNECLRDVEVNMWLTILIKLFFFRTLHLLLRSTHHLRAYFRTSFSHASSSDASTGTNAQAPTVQYVVRKRRPLLVTNQARSQAERERDMQEFKGVDDSYRQLCVMFGLALVFSVSSPAILALLVMLFCSKLKTDSMWLIRLCRRPVAVRTGGAAVWTRYVGDISLAVNFIGTAMVVFVSGTIGKVLLGPPHCPVQYVCYTDEKGVLRYQSALEANRWRVHNSDSTKHWLLAAGIVGAGLVLRMLWSFTLDKPPFHMRQRHERQRKIQVAKGLLRQVQDAEQQQINAEEVDIAYANLWKKANKRMDRSQDPERLLTPSAIIYNQAATLTRDPSNFIPQT